MKRIKTFTARYNSFLHLILIQDGKKFKYFFIRLHNEDKALELMADAEEQLNKLTDKLENANYREDLAQKLESLCGRNA